MSRLRVGLGEFVLILVSVFLALAAERWVASSSDRDLVSQYSEDLIADLVEDSLTIQRWTQSAIARTSALERLLAALNGSAPPLDASDALAIIFAAQVVPIPEFQVATYQDLVSSGNLRLLPPGVRRALVEYHGALAALDRRMELTGYQSKPRFADLVPAVARRDFMIECRGLRVARGDQAAFEECVGREAEELFGAMTQVERTAISSWATMSGIRLELERTLNGTIAFLDALQTVDDSRTETAAALAGRDST